MPLSTAQAKRLARPRRRLLTERVVDRWSTTLPHRAHELHTPIGNRRRSWACSVHLVPAQPVQRQHQSTVRLLRGRGHRVAEQKRCRSTVSALTSVAACPIGLDRQPGEPAPETRVSTFFAYPTCRRPSRNNPGTTPTAAAIQDSGDQTQQHCRDVSCEGAHH